jgi:hypothetical protein
MLPDEAHDTTPQEQIEEVLKNLSYESLKLWQQELQKQKDESNPLRSGTGEKTEGIP